MNGPIKILPPDALLLAIGTSSGRTSVALSGGGPLVGAPSADRATAACGIHARIDAAGGTAGRTEHLIEQVAEVLKVAGCVAGDVRAIVYDRGPGYFTGLRLGCSIAQALGLAWQIPLLGVISLDAMAEQAFAAGHARVFVATDARMNEIYCCASSASSAPAPGDRGIPSSVVHAPAVLPEAAVITLLEGFFGASRGEGAEGSSGDHVGKDGTCAAVGNAFLLFPAAAERASLAGAALLPDVWPHADALIAVARRRLYQPLPGFEDAARPLYVRDRVALDAHEQARLRAAREASQAAAPATGSGSVRGQAEAP